MSIEPILLVASQYYIKRGLNYFCLQDFNYILDSSYVNYTKIFTVMSFVLSQVQYHFIAMARCCQLRIIKGDALHRGSILASHPGAFGSNPGSTYFFSLYCFVF